MNILNIVISIFQILLAIGIIGFWIIFYFTEYKNRKWTEVEFKHELSFPLPDLGWITPNLIVASIGLLLEQDFGYIFSIIGGSGMMFLGLIDLAFSIQNGNFKVKERGFNAYISLIIVSIMLIFGPIFIIYGGFHFLL